MKKEKMKLQTVDVIIPAYNEEASIGKVVRDLPGKLVREIVVVNNNSNDRTAIVAEQAGATVIAEVKKGYGAACLKGISYLRKKRSPPDIVLFIDGDHSDFPAEAPDILAPLFAGSADLVVGSRVRGESERGSMTTPQQFGNWLSTRLIRWLYGVQYTDLGPFRAIRLEVLNRLDMRDETYGWTVEMQVKAAKLRVPSMEVPVSYRKRIGVSKISGTVKGTVMAGIKILWTIFRNL